MLHGGFRVWDVAVYMYWYATYRHARAGTRPADARGRDGRRRTGSRRERRCRVQRLRLRELRSAMALRYVS